ncbi:MAG TPA: VOC family protein [Chloroflexota bacterium]|nr:VOC family protein [Chloroflexota bacterium]
MTLKVESIRSINWNAPDPRAAERFYTEVLNGRVERRMHIRGTDVADVALGNIVLGLFDASAAPAPGVPHHTLQMAWPADEASARAELEAAGVTVEGSRVHGPGPGFSLYVTDPLGNALELAWDPPGSPHG